MSAARRQPTSVCCCVKRVYLQERAEKTWVQPTTASSSAIVAIDELKKAAPTFRLKRRQYVSPRSGCLHPVCGLRSRERQAPCAPLRDNVESLQLTSACWPLILDCVEASSILTHPARLFCGQTRESVDIRHGLGFRVNTYQVYIYTSRRDVILPGTHFMIFFA